MTPGGCYDYRLCSQCSVRVPNAGISHFVQYTTVKVKPKAKHPIMYTKTNKQTNKKEHTSLTLWQRKKKILHLGKRNASVSFTIKLPSLLQRQNFQHLQLLQYHPKHNRKSTAGITQSDKGFLSFFKNTSLLSS